ncbi:LPS assembly lipoprotein LptE [Hymenobacter sp. BT175]|uniref:LptE family protein n=1 Tax=Hymenobacter translucens TaxID=2886507 RepID=UPI001D0EAF19|nr:LptE family protein [Hymenobacter translucens]MCC2546289.1 LPS assembly lipoprotein LptE [Hymenobacter translucens]
MTSSNFKLQAASRKLQASVPALFAWSLWLAACGLLSGCGIYSFTGTNIDPTIKTISIQTFQNNASNGPSFISQRFTETFRDYFQRNTSLKQVPRGGDLQFEGQIIAYDFAPAAIQRQGSQEQAGVNRLTIQVRVKFTNTKDPKQDFEETFQSGENFPASATVTQINDDPAVRTILNNIITDAFNKSVANW